MIRPLRATHRVIFFAFAILLPVLFASGLLSRPHWPSDLAVSDATIPEGQKIVWEKSGSVDRTKVTVRVLSDPSSTNSEQVQLSTSKPLIAPDLLVYWSPQQSNAGLAAEAHLLGPFHVLTRYPLPLEAQEKGFVILYSLARGQVLVSLPVEIQP
jgi:hypothetical protein